MKMKHQFTAQSRKYFQKISHVIEPLKIHFGIDIFWHYSILPDGHFMHLTNNPDVMDGYFGRGSHLSNPFFKHPKYYKPQAILTHQIKDAEYQKTLEFTKKQYKYDRSLLILDQKDRVYHGVGFATTRDPQQLNILFQDLELVNKFLNYYHSEMDDVFKKIDNQKIPLAEILGTRFYMPPPAHITGLSQMRRTSFLSAIGQAQAKPTLHLTPREIECIVLHLQGKAASQIAERLQLSRRTVEHYMESLKAKLECRTKSEIYDRIKILMASGSLPDDLLSM